MSHTLLFSKQDRVLILAVHPDDETLGTGGLIQRAAAAGAAVKIAFITDGDNNPWPQRALEKRWKISNSDRARWGRRRCKEALAALAALHVDESQAVFLGLPDQGITALLANGDQAVINRFTDEIADWRPTLLLSPAMQDKHPDHNALAVLITLALMRLPPHLTPKVLAYLIHGQHALASTPFTIDLSEQELAMKRQAITAHETQMTLSRKRFLGYTRAQEKFFNAEPARRYHALHVIEEAVAIGRKLKIRMRLSPLDRFAGKPLLYMVSKRANQPLHTRFAIRNGKAAIYDYANNTHIGDADIQIKGTMAKIEIPLSLFADAGNVYLKLARQRGFFDMCGWREVSLDDATEKVDLDSVGIIPCYDVEDFCGKVIRESLHCLDHVIVIDDGSTDKTAQILAKLKAQYPQQITVVSFPHNRGKGVALMAGFCEALNRFNFISLVTLDADGQHPCEDIPYLVKKVVTGAELVIGERQVRLMPGRSRLGNTLATGALRWLYPHAPTDTQSGMRAFTQELVEEIVKAVPGSRYETEFQILLLALSKKRRIASVTIPTIYIDNNRSSKFRPIADSLRIMRTLIHWRIRHIIPVKTS